jgi:hypothetical protein
MTKSEQFLWIVQTTMLANGINMAAQGAEKYRHVFSAVGTIFIADETVRASEVIPEEKSAIVAAHEFCYWMLPNLRVLRGPDDTSMTPPMWLRLGPRLLRRSVDEGGPS